MTTVLDVREIKEEIAVKLRNADIFTTTQRSVTTTTATGSFSGDSTFVINKTDVKNIRSITVAGTPLVFGTEYSVDYDFLDTTIKCKITFVAAQTGNYSIPYDHGPDKIFPDLPRTDLSISSFPRIAIDVIGSNTAEIEIGAGNNLTAISFSVIVYDDNSEDIEDYLKAIWTFFIANKKNFYHLVFITKLATGPLLPFTEGRQKVMQKSMDFLAPFNLETA